MLDKIIKSQVWSKDRWIRFDVHPIKLEPCVWGGLQWCFYRCGNVGRLRKRTYTINLQPFKPPKSDDAFNNEASNQTTHHTWCRKRSSFHNSLLNIWQVASLIYNDFILSHYSFAVRKTVYNFSSGLSRKNEKPKGFVLKQNFSCVYQIQPHFKATLTVKMSAVCEPSLKSFEEVWRLITVSNSRTRLYRRRWVCNKKTIKHWEFIWNAWNSFHLKSHRVYSCFVC